MFNLKDFIFKGIKGMIGSEPDYKVIEYSAGWFDKGVLTSAELAEIDQLIDAKNMQKEAPAEESDGSDI